MWFMMIGLKTAPAVPLAEQASEFTAPDILAGLCWILAKSDLSWGGTGT